MCELLKGSIYKIIHNQSNICYIGSTLNKLNYRWASHKAGYKKNKNKEYGNISIYKYFDKFGIENFKIILIKEYEIYDILQLHVYEQLWINKLKTINKIDVFSPFNKKQYRKNYYNIHKDKKLEQSKLRYNEKKIEINNQKKENRITCYCGINLRKADLARHKKSNFHITFVKIP